MRIRFIIPMLLLASVASIAQQKPWQLKTGTDIYSPNLSPDGKRLLFCTNDDSVVATCVDVASGNKMWSRTLKHFKQYQLVRFVGNDTVLLGQENRYEFVAAKDGATIKTLPIIGDDWSDARWEAKADPEYDTLKPYFKGSMGIFYFDDGMQILDLSVPAIVYQTESAPSKIKYKEWESMLMINPISGADSIYFLDVAKKSIAYVGSKDKNDINTNVYQPFAVGNNRLLLFNDGNIESIDLETRKQNAIIPVDPDDPEFYAPVIFKKDIYLLVSDEGIQKLYNTKDGSLLWQTPEKAIPGIAEQLVELPNDEALLMAYEEDGRMVTYKINANTGKILWSKPLFVQDGKLEPGHKQGGKFWATVGKFALIALKTALRDNGHWSNNSFSSGGRFNIPTYEQDPFHWEHRQQAIREANESYNSWINKKKESEGYTTILGTKDNQVVMATAGKIYSIKDGKTSENYDAEGILTLNLADGSVVKWAPCEMIAKSEKGKFNAVNDLSISTLDSAKVLVGVHDVYVSRDGNVEKLSFGEDELTFINASTNAVTFMANHDDDYYDYWRVDASKAPATKYLIARSTDRSVVFPDTVAISTMLNITNTGISAFPVKAGDVGSATFTSPKWSITEKDLDQMDMGEFNTKLEPTDSLQGVRIRGGDVYILGDDRIGYVSSDGSCRWTQEWSPKKLRTKLGVTTVGKGLVYSTGDITAVLANSCPPAVIGSNEISFSDSMVLVSPDKRVVVINTDDGIIYGYDLN